MTTYFEYLPNRRLCRISGDTFDGVREHFSIKNKNAFFMKKFGNRWAQEREYAITPTGLFEPGMFFEIATYIKHTHPDEIISLGAQIDEVLNIVNPVISDTPFADTYVSFGTKYLIRDYQLETVKIALKAGRGIIKIGTGGGKTLTIASLISSVYKLNEKMKCILIVPDLGLVDQTAKDFAEYNVPFKYTCWTGSIDFDITANVIIANTGVIQSRFEENDWIKNVDLVVVDECHKLKKGNKVCKLIHNIKTPNKFGLTGTLPDNKIDEWNIIGKLGKVIYEKSSFELREEKYLVNAEVKVIEIQYKNKVPKATGVEESGDKFRSELEFIYNNKYRNDVIMTLGKNFNNNILILVNHIAHGKALYDHLSQSLTSKKVYFIQGEVEVEERAKVIKEMENNNNVVCIAISAIFSTGINIKNLHMVMFTAGGKSFIRTIQSIGRGLRLNQNKEKLIIIDIADKLRYSIQHGERRKEIYKLEQIPFTETLVIEK